MDLGLLVMINQSAILFAVGDGMMSAITMVLRFGLVHACLSHHFVAVLEAVWH